MNKYKINCGIGVIGTQTITKTNHGDTSEIIITNTRSFNSYNIPPVIVFCEDKVAEELIIHSLSYRKMNVGSFNFRRCGSWANIIISLAGCLLYSKELIKTGNEKVLEVVGVVDGDISKREIEDMISKIYEGDFIPEMLEEITEQISQHITSFNIPTALLSKKNIKGKPELNLKNMMDEIDEDKINNVFKDKENELHSWLDKTTDENSNKNIMLSLKDICREKKETLEIINFSKDIQFLEEDGKVNYHKYFKRLKNKIGNRWFSNYTFTNQPIFR